MTERNSDHLPTDLRPRLEAARLDLLALFRALDQLALGADEAPQEELEALFELDADFAEALVVLDWPVGAIQLPSMLRDTLASLDRLPPLRASLVSGLARRTASALKKHQTTIRASLDPRDAYNNIPVG